MAASTLLAGDIAVIGYNTGQTDGAGSTADTFRIVLLKPVGSGTVIFLTDRSWNGTAFVAGANDGTITFTAGADLPAGTVIDLPMAGGFNPEEAGDAIYAFQGTDANTPVRFLTAIEIADGNTAFSGSLANTGLTLGVNAVAVAQDSAAYHGPTTEAFANVYNAKPLLQNINDASNWVGSDAAPGPVKALDQPDHSGPYNTASDFSLWLAGSTGGTGIASVHGDSTVSGGNVAYNLSQLYTGTGLLSRPQDIVFDTVHGKFFIADSNFGVGINRVLQGNISDLLGNPSTAPTLTVLYSDTGTTTAAQINNLEVDVNSGIVYFNHGQRFEKVSYDTANQTPTVLANFGAGSGNPVGTTNNFPDDFVIDFATGTVYLSSHRVVAALDGDAVSRNYVYKITGLTPSTAAGALTFGGGQVSVLPFSPDNDGDGVGLEALPSQNGTIEGLALSADGQTLYFATASVLFDHDGDGGFPGDGDPATTDPQLKMGGVYSYALAGNPNGLFTNIYQPTDDGDASQTINAAFGPQGLLDELELDSATGHLYFTDTTGDQLSPVSNPPGDEGVWRVSTSGGTPSYFANVNNINALGPGSLFLNHAPTLTSTGATPTTTETAGAGSGASSLAQPIATIDATDVETASKTDQLAGAVMRISSGFQSGVAHQDSLTIAGATSGNLVLGGKTIAYSYNATTGVMTLSGPATFDSYENALGQIRFSVSGDDPTAFGAATSRTIAWSVSDGLNHSDETSTTVTVAGVNDAPVNTVGVAAAGIEDGPAVNLTGISVADPDADPAAQNISVTFAVTGGTVSLLTNVVNGVVAGQISGGANGSATVTVTATQNQINATLAAAGGLSYTAAPNFNGTAVLTVTTNDNGFTGTGGAQSDSDTKDIVVAPVNDPHTGTATITGTPAQYQTLTAANTLGDVDGMGAVSYQWKANGIDIGGATGSTLVLGQAQVGAAITVTASFTDGGGTLETETSAATGAVANVNDLPTGAVTITGTPTQNQTLTAANTLADLDGLGAITYQWKANGVDIGGATGSTLVLGQAQVGATITVAASYIDLFGAPESVVSSATTAVVNVNDAPTGAVSITGVATEDQVLTAVSTLADLDGLGTLHYQWQRDSGAGFVNVGADQATYALGDADVGGVVRVVVSYTDGQGSAESVASAATAAIANINDPFTGGVSITGTSTENQVLTAVSTLADVDGLGTLHYQWQRDTGGGFVNMGADQGTYTLGDADVGGVVRVVVSYTDGQGSAESATSAATAAVVGVNDPHTGGVSIAGAATEDQVLTAVSTLADLDGLGTLHYQWQRDSGAGFVNVGTDQATYALGDADVGGVVRVVVSYTDGQGFAESATSAATGAIANINDLPTGGASITGTATEDQVLTAVSTLADVDGLGTLHYQWQRDTGGGFVNAGTDQATYTLDDADVGGVVRVVISYTDALGSAEAATSAATGVIANINDAPTGAVTIAGTTTEGQTLTAAHTLADADGLGAITYQWKEGGVDIAGATNPTLVLGAAQIGKTITVTASYTDARGTAESVTSAATAAVVNLNDPPTGTVTIAGAASQGSVLTASNTLADLDGLGPITYQWRSNGTAIAGATTATFTPGQAQVGTTITVTANYTDLQGTAEAVTSGPTAAVANVNDSPTGGIAIVGSKTVGSTLTVSSTLADADGLGAFSYEWLRDGVTIGGATAASYVVGAADVGKTVSVRASYTDGFGTPESATSAGIVGEAAPVTPGGPGTPTEPVSKLTIEAARFDVPPVNGAPAKSPVTLVADSLGGEIDPDPSTAYLTRFGQSAGPDAGRVVANALGTLDFTATLNQAGNTETFSLIFDNGVAQNGFWVANSNGHWVNLADPALGGSAQVNGTQMRLDFTITDGGEFDLDGAVNGSITGSGFVAMTNLSIIGQVPDSGDSFALF